jgi:mannose-6-phosphate isomerase-like protein (cupin superfamily)
MRTLVLPALLLASVAAGSVASRASDGEVRLVSHDRVEAAFAKGMPLVEVGDYKIHASRRDGPGGVEIHTRDTDIAYILQGSATLVTGGTPVDVKTVGVDEFRGSAIRGGETRELAPGDVVVIPNGVPHWFERVDAPLLYYVVKVRQAPRAESPETPR